MRAAAACLVFLSCSDLSQLASASSPTLEGLKDAACIRWEAASGVPATALTADVRISYGYCGVSAWGCALRSGRWIHIVPGNSDSMQPHIVTHEVGHLLGLEHHAGPGIMANPIWPTCISKEDLAQLCEIHRCAWQRPECKDR